MLHLSIVKEIHTSDGPRRLHLELTLAPGEKVALFGPSGAGKTTILRMVAGLDAPDAGRITWGDAVWFDRARGIDLPARLRGIGYLFQEGALFPNMTVAGNLRFAQPRPDPGRLAALLAWTGLAALADRLPGQLSGGQQQRAALARALAREPGLLLLDEPFSSQDHALRERLRRDLEGILARFPMAMLLVSHDPGEVFALADRVVCLDRGEVTAVGAPREVMLADGGVSGRYLLHGTVLVVERTGVVETVTVAVGGDYLTTLATPEEAANLAPGDRVRLYLQGGNAVIRGMGG